jgi:GNAT superfamily N-acetyltransferase
LTEPVLKLADAAVRLCLRYSQEKDLFESPLQMLVKRGEFTIDTDRASLDVGAIQDFLSNESYWARRRTREQTETAIHNSLCFGLFRGTRQIGFARVVSDRATFAYVGDVFVIDEFRGRGLGRWLMETMLEHPELQGLRRWVLATRDAHGLYEQYGFDGLKHPDRWMELAAPDAY